MKIQCSLRNLVLLKTGDNKFEKNFKFLFKLIYFKTIDINVCSLFKASWSEMEEKEEKKHNEKTFFYFKFF